MEFKKLPITLLGSVLGVKRWGSTPYYRNLRPAPVIIEIKFRLG